MPREPDTNFGRLIYLDPRADGFRLPYVQEFDKLCSASDPKSLHQFLKEEAWPSK